MMPFYNIWMVAFYRTMSREDVVRTSCECFLAVARPIFSLFYNFHGIFIWPQNVHISTLTRLQFCVEIIPQPSPLTLIFGSEQTPCQKVALWRQCVNKRWKMATNLPWTYVLLVDAKNVPRWYPEGVKTAIYQLFCRFWWTSRLI